MEILGPYDYCQTSYNEKKNDETIAVMFLGFNRCLVEIFPTDGQKKKQNLKTFSTVLYYYIRM